MSGYNRYVGGIVGGLQNSNMQKHMGTMTDDLSPERKKALQKIIDYEYNVFIDLIYKTALGNDERYWEGKQLKNYFINNERDLIPIFEKMNEDCLNDPEFSKSIVNGKLYAKQMGKEHDHVLYYPPHHVGSVSNDIDMDLLFLPSANIEEPNKFRIDVKEYLQDKSYINFGVDIGDDGTILYNQPTIVSEKDGNISKTPTDLSQAHIKFNEQGIDGIRDAFLYLFEKTGIIEDTSNKHR